MNVSDNSIHIFGGKSGTPRNHEWTVKEYAKLEKVSPITVRRWISKGAVDVRRTPGGGIRIIGTK